MRALIQRVTHGAVSVDNIEIASIKVGMVVLLGVARDDTPEAATYLAKRTADLRIFGDAAGVPNISVKDSGGEVLVVSQFTLYADTDKGNRPSYLNAAPPDIAGPLYESYITALRAIIGIEKVKTGVFRAMRRCELGSMKISEPGTDGMKRWRIFSMLLETEARSVAFSVSSGTEPPRS